MKRWDQFVVSMEKEIGTEASFRWIRSLKVLRFDARNLFLEALDSLHVHWFEEHLRWRLEREFFNENGQKIKVHLLQKEKKIASPPPAPPFQFTSDRLEREATFSQFIHGTKNEMAYHLLSELSSPPLFNPIYLYGPQFSGKTHLLQATVQRFQQNGFKAFFIRAETFSSHVVQAIRLGKMEAFRSAYRHLDLLAIDEIDTLQGKEATQEEFFHTFNVLHTAGKFLLLSSSLPPSKLEKIEERLISRFEWGICLEVEKENPFEILKLKRSLWKLPYPDPFLIKILETFPSHSLLALQALSLFSPKQVPKTPLPLILPDLYASEMKQVISPEKIIATVALHYGISQEEILGKSQRKEVVFPRQMAIYLCRKKLGLPLQGIGKIFQRDHSTVLSSIKKVEEKTGELEEISRKL